MVILVRFGELALKSRYVRRQLRDRLVANIQDRFAAEGVECVTESDEARVYVHTADPLRARGLLARVFGIVSMSPAAESKSDLDAVRGLAVAEANSALIAGRSFAVRPRRTGTHPFSSQDIARDVGAAILAANPGTRVDLDEPDVEVHIEVRRNRAFVFRDIWAGPGGLPLGSQGRALALVDGDAGMVAAWMGMKRGCRVVVAAPDEGPRVDALRRWDTHLKVLRATSVGDLDALVRIARADAVFLGTRWDAFGEGSRPRVDVPVFEPTLGLLDDEVSRMSDAIRGP